MAAGHDACQQSHTRVVERGSELVLEALLETFQPGGQAGKLLLYVVWPFLAALSVRFPNHAPIKAQGEASGRV